MLRRLLDNHVLANLTFLLILIQGYLAFEQMPRSRDPEINFNWVNILTTLPGASPAEIEKRITDPIEDKIKQTIKDIRFVSSDSRAGASLMLVRFEQMSEREFDKHIIDLRREVQNVYTDQLPPEANDPEVLVLTSSNAFPTAILAVETQSYDENFRRYISNLDREIEALKGVDEALDLGVGDPELHIAFYPERLEGLGLSPTALADTVAAYFRDVSIGDIETESGKWIIRLDGTSSSLEELSAFPILGSNGIVELGSVADVYFSTDEDHITVNFQKRPAAMFSITKQNGASALGMLDKLNKFIVEQNNLYKDKGYQLILVDDRTIDTRESIGLMVDNAVIGLLFVLVVTFIFLGTRIAFLTAIGIPFTLAGTFIIINLMGFALSNMVLLGVVVALGMIVDDAVVVVEAIYYRLQRGVRPIDAAIDALREVAAPVLTSVLTTISVFLPLIFLPGILGEFMRLLPLVVCIALLVSLVEAFWILPSHVTFIGQSDSESKVARIRKTLTRKIRSNYSLLLVRAIRNPLKTILISLMFPMIAVVVLASGLIKFNFFLSEPFPMFYADIELPAGANIEKTQELTTELEEIVLSVIKPEELRSSITYAGQKFTETTIHTGSHFGQVFVTLHQQSAYKRKIRDIYNEVTKAIGDEYKGAKVNSLLVEDGPPVGKPIAIKLLGDDYDELNLVASKMQAYMSQQTEQDKPLFVQISTDYKPGAPEMVLSLDGDAIKRAGLHPAQVTRSLQSYVDGELVTRYQRLGEEIDVRLLAVKNPDAPVEALLEQTMSTPDGSTIVLGELVNVSYEEGLMNIFHYSYSRSITLESDIDDDLVNTVQANQILLDYWDSIRLDYPGVKLDTSGQLDDIQESLDSMLMLFVMGVGLIYLILGTQFKSYFQPLIVLLSVPLAFAGVILGAIISGNTVLSMYTLYGVIALSGISVNAAIVLISAANARIESGMNVVSATVFAAKRRVIPVLITSFTTIAGLFSLAAGVAGESLVWSPLASAIVSGLFFSTMLILIIIPIFYSAWKSFVLRDS